MAAAAAASSGIDRADALAGQVVADLDAHSHWPGWPGWPGWPSRMTDANLTRSMSRKACSPDNAACEGYFGSLKTELFYPRFWKTTTIEQLIEVVDSYIRWYSVVAGVRASRRGRIRAGPSISSILRPLAKAAASGVNRPDVTTKPPTAASAAITTYSSRTVVTLTLRPSTACTVRRTFH